MVVPMVLFAVAFGVGGTLLIQRVVNLSSDRLLTGAVRAIAESATVEDGRIWVNIPPWVLGLLDNPERDSVYYSVVQDGVLLTGYADLQVPGSLARGDVAILDSRHGNDAVRQVSQRVALVGVDRDVIVTVAQSLDSRRAIRDDLVGRLLLLEAALLVVSAWLVLLAVRWNLRPLGRIKRYLERTGSGDVRGFQAVDLRGVPNELRPALEAFNQLLTRLDEMNKAAMRFSADASHQMRTPLTVLKMNLELLAKRWQGRDVDSEMLGDAREAADRLNRLLLQLLALARAESGADRGLEKIDLSAHVGEVVRRLSRDADRAGVSMRLEVENGTYALANPELLDQVLSNLLDNAIKYGAGGPVRVQVGTTDHRPFVAISDRGPGIPPEDRVRAFERFTRLSAAQDVTGSGLGLSIVKMYVDQQGGSIELLDNEDGAGLTVVLSLRELRPVDPAA
nr:sensor histidine kinase [Luteimonas sp. BDR2-5]